VIRRRNVLLLTAAFMLMLAAWFMWGMRHPAYVAKSQAELDMNRGSRLIFSEADLPKAFRLNDVYWAQRFKQPDVKSACGKQILEGVVVGIRPSFSDGTQVTIIGNELYRVDYPPVMPLAYEPAGQDLLDAEFNPKANAIQLRITDSRLSTWQKMKIRLIVDRSDLLLLPEIRTDGESVLDGTSAWILVCHNGLRYAFSRHLQGDKIEWPISQLLEFADVDEKS
jgi:hypothetical protein